MINNSYNRLMDRELELKITINVLPSDFSSLCDLTYKFFSILCTPWEFNSFCSQVYNEILGRQRKIVMLPPSNPDYIQQIKTIFDSIELAGLISTELEKIQTLDFSQLDQKTVNFLFPYYEPDRDRDFSTMTDFEKDELFHRDCKSIIQILSNQQIYDLFFLLSVRLEYLTAEQTKSLDFNQLKEKGLSSDQTRYLFRSYRSNTKEKVRALSEKQFDVIKEFLCESQKKYRIESKTLMDSPF